jgi:hypothetical protein
MMGDLPSLFGLPDHPAADISCFATPVPSASKNPQSNKINMLAR